MLSLLFVKPPAGMWICQGDRQPPTYLHAPPTHLPPHSLSELCHLQPHTSACPLPPITPNIYPLKAETLGFQL